MLWAHVFFVYIWNKNLDQKIEILRGKELHSEAAVPGPLWKIRCSSSSPTFRKNTLPKKLTYLLMVQTSGKLTSWYMVNISLFTTGFIHVGWLALGFLKHQKSTWKWMVGRWIFLFAARPLRNLTECPGNSRLHKENSDLKNTDYLVVKMDLEGQIPENYHTFVTFALFDCPKMTPWNKACYFLRGLGLGVVGPLDSHDLFTWRIIPFSEW